MSTTASSKASSLNKNDDSTLLLNGYSSTTATSNNWPSYLEKEIFSKPNLLVNNLDQVQQKLKRLICDGPTKLQVLADFDFTLSNFCCPDGSRAISTHSLLENDNTKLLLSKYLAIEYDRNLTVEEKIPHMVEWWTQSHKEVVGDNYDKEKLRKVVKDSTSLQLRTGFVEFFNLLEKFDVPLVIFSGGIGDVIQVIIEEACGKVPKNVHIISNWMIYDEQGKVIGFKDPIVHSFNKNGSVIKEEDKQFFDNLRSRPNILLMGDSLGDSTMDVGLELEQVVFKLGFYNSKIEDSLTDYTKSFDVVCVRDQTLNSAIAVLTASCTGLAA